MPNRYEHTVLARTTNTEGDQVAILRDESEDGRTYLLFTYADGCLPQLEGFDDSGTVAELYLKTRSRWESEGLLADL